MNFDPVPVVVPVLLFFWPSTFLVSVLLPGQVSPLSSSRIQVLAPSLEIEGSSVRCVSLIHCAGAFFFPFLLLYLFVLVDVFS